jgi:hypothetical protein
MDSYSVPFYYTILSWIFNPLFLLFIVILIIIIVKSRHKKSPMNDSQKTLRDFIQTAKIQGSSPEVIRQQLVGAGWAAEDVDSALQAATSSVPIPPPVNVSSGLDVALYAGIFITLYASVIQLGTVLFQLINQAFPDPRSALYGRTAFRYSSTLLHWGIATVVVAFPLFVWLTSIVRRHMRENPAKARVAIRRSLTYFTLFVAGGTVMGTLIGIIYNFLEGDMGARFMFKSLAVLILGAGVFMYYYPDARHKFETR